MRLLEIVFGLTAVGKGALLLLDPNALIRFGRQFTSLFSPTAKKTLDHEVDRVLDYARQGPGGLNTLGWVVLGGGLLVLGRALRAK